MLKAAMGAALRWGAVRHCRPLHLTCAFAILLLWVAAYPARAQQAATATQLAGPQVKVYGFILLNAAYNSGAPAPVDAPITATGGRRGSFLMTGRQSRLGVQVRQEKERYKLGGALELDVAGLLASSSTGGPLQSAPRLRHAYFNLDVGGGSSFLFGQYWTVVAPLHPTSLAQVSTAPLTSQGNISHRVPQVRYTYTNAPFVLEAAVLRPFVGEAPSTVASTDYLSAGEYSRLPFTQARVAYQTPGAALGLSGHYGQMDFGLDSLRDDRTATYALALDAQLTLWAVALRAEVARSQNNRSLLGLAGTRVIERGRAPGLLDELEDGRSTHAWGQLSYTLRGLNLNGGAGIERTSRDQYNRMVFANAIYTLEQLPVTFALETSHLSTMLAPPVQDNVVVNLAARYSF